MTDGGGRPGEIGAKAISRGNLRFSKEKTISV